MMSDIKERVKKIICNVLEIDDSNILDDQVDFKDLPDLEVDSITALDILAGLEKEFKIIIDQENLMRMANVESAVVVLEEIINNMSQADSV